MQNFYKGVSLIIFQFFTSTILMAQTATISLTQERQIIKGFGGINHPTWYSDLNAAERALAFGNGAGQLGLTVLRTYVSDKSSEWSLGLQTAKYAYDNGVTVFASPWNPPAGMFITVNGVKRINPATYAQYADHLNSYVTHMKNNGVNLYAISTQNEPDYAHDWTEWSPQESVDFIKGFANRIDCKIITPESFQYRKNIYDPILNDPAALANVDIFGTHLYGTQYKDFPYPLFQQKGAGKELWMTEVYTDSKYDANLWNDAVINNDQHALKVAEHIHYSMVEGQFQTYVFWPLRRYYALIHDGNSDGNGNTPAAAGTATKRGYCMAQFSKWVRPGYVRVEATKSPTTNVFVSAYKKDNDVVIVVVNKNTTSKTITLDIPGTLVKTWEQFTTSGSKNLAKGNNINGGGNFQVTLDAASVTTFVGKGASGVPVVAITSPSVNQVFEAPASITLDATATDADGTISNVFLYNGSTVLSEQWVAPYDFVWENVPVGTYTLTAVATDNDGNKTTSAPITITVKAPQTPYNGTPHQIPGRIEAEEYDLGGEGMAFHEANTNGNEGGATLRNDEVDIETTQDTEGAYNIGYVLRGEWLEYTVNVVAAGFYDLSLRLAADGDGKTMHVEIDGVDVTGTIAVPNTGGWQTWQTVTLPNISLTAGKHVMRIVFESNYMNLNYVEFKDVVTGLKSQSNSGIQVYPNPYKEVSNLYVSGKFKYQIFNNQGQVLESGSGAEHVAIGQNLSDGTYFLQVNYQNKSQVFKFTKF